MPVAESTQYNIVWMRTAFFLTEPPFVHTFEDMPFLYSCMHS